MFFKCLFIILLCVSSVRSAKILGVFHNPSKSHFSLGNTLLHALAARGHEVTMLGPYKVNSSLKNYESIEVDGLQSSKDSVIEKVKTDINGTTYRKILSTVKNYRKMNVLFLNHPAVKNLLASGRKFDVVIVDWLFNDIFLAMANHFNAHSIVFSAITTSVLVNKITANPAPSSYVTNMLPALSDKMNFFQRLANLLTTVFYTSVDRLVRPAQNRFLQEHFPNAPHITELLHNVSLVFVNSHFTSETPRPFVPNMIPIGGFHVKEPKELEGDLKTFMDEASEGVVYCSFGSIVKSSEMSQNKIKAILKAFSNLNVKVLWKFESDDIPELPPNVKTGKWFPQGDILAHPNLKAFVTHGGLLSMTETIYHGVPVVATPFFGDQESNVEHAVSKGYAVRLRFHEFTEETLTRAIKEVLNNPKYSENAKQRSTWFKDQPIHPLDNAVYWIEYVVRHNGAHHLKTAALKLNWYQYYLLDVIAFIAVILLSVVVILSTTCRLLIKKIFRKPIIAYNKNSNNNNNTINSSKDVINYTKKNLIKHYHRVVIK